MGNGGIIEDAGRQQRPVHHQPKHDEASRIVSVPWPRLPGLIRSSAPKR
jgi:hypothetical protein